MKIDKQITAQEFLAKLEPLTSETDIELAFATLKTMPADVRAHVVDAVEKHNINNLVQLPEDALWGLERVNMVINTPAALRKPFGISDEEYNNVKADFDVFAPKIVSATYTFKNILAEKGEAADPFTKAYMGEIAMKTPEQLAAPETHLDLLLETRRFYVAAMEAQASAASKPSEPPKFH